MNVCCGCPDGWCKGCFPDSEILVTPTYTIDAFLHAVSPAAQEVVLEWFVTPYTLREMLDVQFPLVADAVLAELSTYDVVIWNDGLPEFDFGWVKL